jgi:hypothetical protein
MDLKDRVFVMIMNRLNRKMKKTLILIMKLNKDLLSLKFIFQTLLPIMELKVKIGLRNLVFQSSTNTLKYPGHKKK